MNGPERERRQLYEDTPVDQRKATEDYENGQSTYREMMNNSSVPGRQEHGYRDEITEEVLTVLQPSAYYPKDVSSNPRHSHQRGETAYSCTDGLAGRSSEKRLWPNRDSLFSSKLVLNP